MPPLEGRVEAKVVDEFLDAVLVLDLRHGVALAHAEELRGRGHWRHARREGALMEVGLREGAADRGKPHRGMHAEEPAEKAQPEAGDKRAREDVEVLCCSILMFET